MKLVFRKNGAMLSNSYKSHFGLLFLLQILFVSGTFAQATMVNGRVVADKSPLEYANIIVYSLADSSKIVDAAITDSLGGFSFQGLPLGAYILKIQTLGYLSQRKNFVLDAAHRQVSFDEIELATDFNLLKTVEVTAQKRLMKKTANGFIINASDNIAQATGTATDLLRNTPTVVVDEEGSITIRGKTPLILVNGRNSTLSATDRIPASSIESIEIINNPSAKYDADAEGGIINILLKKNLAGGTNGSVALGGGFGARGRLSSAALLSHQQGKWNLGLAYDNRFSNRTRKAAAERTNFNLPDEHFLIQNRHDLRLEETQNMKLNADFVPNDKNSFSLELLGNLNREDNHETLVSLFEKQDLGFFSKDTRHSEEFPREKAVEGALSYNRKFDDSRKTLSVSLSSAFNFDRENTDIATQSLDVADSNIGNPFLERTHNYENGNISNFRVDFAQPLGDKAMLETGYKGIARTTDANFQSLYFANNEYVPNPLASNLFRFDEQIHAAYLIYSNSLGSPEAPKIKYDLGIRGEQVWNKGDAETNGILFKNDYFHFFPSANIAYYFSPSDFLKLAYNRRINRPSLGQLNPFIDITDALNPHGGNPYLQPELVSAWELGFNKEWKKASAVSNVFYRYATNIIQRFISLDSNAVALVIPKNFGNATTYGFEEIVSVYPTKLWSFNASFSLFQQSINGKNVDGDAVNDYLSWYAKLINNFALWHGGKLQLIANYNSPIATPQGTRVAVYNVDGGFQQKLFNGKGALGLVVTDIFNTQKSGFTAVNSEFDYHRNFKVDTRAVLLTFTYSFKTLAKEELLENKFSND